MRNWLYYILSGINKLPTSRPDPLHGPFDVENISFRWGNYIEVLIKKFQQELKEVYNRVKKTKARQRNGKTLFIVNCMSWDVLFRKDIFRYFAGINKLVEILKETIKKDFLRVIWISGVANKDNIINSHFRTVNQVVLRKMESIGIEVLDVNTMLYSVNQYTRDGAHYLIIKPADQGKIYGQFGLGVADRIVDQICS